jgi:hypothetical protein
MKGFNCRSALKKTFKPTLCPDIYVNTSLSLDEIPLSVASDAPKLEIGTHFDL